MQTTDDKWDAIFRLGFPFAAILGAIIYTNLNRPPTPPPPAAPQFSTTDRAETDRWLDSLQTLYTSAANTGNPEYRRRTLAAVSATLRQAVGQNIRWKFQVTALGTNWLGFGSDYVELDSVRTYSFANHDGEAETGASHLYLFREEDIPTDIYSTIRTGDTIEVAATVKDCSTQSVGFAHILLDQVRPIRVNHSGGAVTEIREPDAGNTPATHQD